MIEQVQAVTVDVEVKTDELSAESLEQVAGGHGAGGGGGAGKVSMHDISFAAKIA